jgi:hypothetical protein
VFIRICQKLNESEIRALKARAMSFFGLGGGAGPASVPEIPTGPSALDIAKVS